MTSFEMLRASDRKSLRALADVLHDECFDLDGLKCEEGVLSLPFARMESKKGWIFWTSRLPDDPSWDTRLVVQGVQSVAVENDQGIVTYTLNHLSWSDANDQLTIASNQAMKIVVTADVLDVATEAQP